MKNISWKWGVVAIVIIVSLVYILPTIDMAINGKSEPTLWPHKKINLGLDLQGGMHLLLEVQTEKAVENQMELLMHELRSILRKKNIGYNSITIDKKTRISVKLEGEDNIQKFDDLIAKDFGNLYRETSEPGAYILKYTDKEADYMKKMATDQALETIRNRIDEFGVSEPDIRIQGHNRILVQLPGIKDTKRAKDLIGKTALLEFKLVDETHSVESALNGNVPPDSEILYQVIKNKETNTTRKVPYLIKKRTSVSGSDLTDARVQINAQYNEPYVSIKFNRKGATIFERVTGENINHRLAIVLDNTVYSAPNIKSKISGGAAIIEGNFSSEEAHDLAIALRAGALPAPVKVLEERTVGPSLGKDSIKKGLISMAVGALLVVLFMAVYYNGAGVIADFALIVNIFLIAGALAAFQATLTLPGIAGIILTIGMAVDANVLIYERIREETALGKPPRAAVYAGFDRATLTILDANITTIIVAIVLFQFGTGPVKGFAVTLTLGILASLFTSLILSRLIFDYFLINRKIKRLSI